MAVFKPSGRPSLPASPLSTRLVAGPHPVIKSSKRKLLARCCVHEILSPYRTDDCGFGSLISQAVSWRRTSTHTNGLCVAATHPDEACVPDPNMARLVLTASASGSAPPRFAPRRPSHFVRMRPASSALSGERGFDYQIVTQKPR